MLIAFISLALCTSLICYKIFGQKEKIDEKQMHKIKVDYYKKSLAAKGEYDKGNYLKPAKK